MNLIKNLLVINSIFSDESKIVEENLYIKTVA